MSLNRREMLRLGAAGAGGLLLSSAGLAAETPLVFNLKPNDPLAPITPSVPAAPAAVRAAPGGIDPVLFDKAKAALQSHRFFIPRRDVIGIVDFAKASNSGRFHVVDLESGRVESHLVAHGRGSDPDHSGFLERFSNGFGSLASSNGTYITADTYNGKYGHSMKVRGLDWSNNNAEARAIVIHNAWYAEPEVAAAHGKLGRSEGCFAFSRASQWSVMDRLGGGRMIYADKLA